MKLCTQKHLYFIDGVICESYLLLEFEFLLDFLLGHYSDLLLHLEDMGYLQIYSFLDYHLNKMLLSYFDILICTNSRSRRDDKLLILFHETFAELFRKQLQGMPRFPQLRVQDSKYPKLKL